MVSYGSRKKNILHAAFLWGGNRCQRSHRSRTWCAAVWEGTGITCHHFLTFQFPDPCPGKQGESGFWNKSSSPGFFFLFKGKKTCFLFLSLLSGRVHLHVTTCEANNRKSWCTHVRSCSFLFTFLFHASFRVMKRYFHSQIELTIWSSFWWTFFEFWNYEQMTLLPPSLAFALKLPLVIMNQTWNSLPLSSPFHHHQSMDALRNEFSLSLSLSEPLDKKMR